MQTSFSNKIKDHFMKALDLDPNFSQAHYQLALIDQKNGNDKEAEIHLLKAIELDLLKLVKIEKKTNILLERSQFQNAKFLFLNTQNIKNNCAITYYVLSCLYLNQMKISKAKKSLIKSIDLYPLFASSHRDYGILCLKEKDLILAKQHLDLSLELDYGDSKTHLYLGIVMRENDLYDQAEQYFLASLDINPKFENSFIEMAYLKLLMKEEDEARSYYEQAKKLSTDIQDERMDSLK